MKKQVLVLALISVSATAFTQNSIPNGNFENWNAFTYDVLTNYPAISGPEAFFKCGATSPNTVKSTDAYHGTYSLQMTTIAGMQDTCFGYVVNTNPDNSFPNWPGGMAYNQKPTGMRGYYKSAIASPDTGRVLLIFKSGGSNIGMYIFPFYGTQSTYTLFNFPLVPALPSTPDTVIIAAASSDFSNNNINVPGSMLKLDSLSFTGVSSQPALFNGSFENWTSNTIYSPMSWIINGDVGTVQQTIDKAAGSYAAEIITYQGDNNGNPIARAGMISNGYWDNSCICWKGGYPFTNQIDTLVFSYKYAPISNDSAEVMLTFKKNGSQVFGSPSIRLGASSTYQTVQVPFNIGQAIDTAIVQIQSSLWQDTLLSYVGSNLKIDEIHFKSQPLNTSVPTLSVQNSVSIYPNPSSGEFTMQSTLHNLQEVEVYNALGEKVITKSLNSKSCVLHMNQEGIYFVKMTSNGKIFTKKLIVNK